ncbi:DUF2141 domain-containing protein [Acuticoccus sp. I52.16.1]|uniref:DUF2141 domain-containing protein n=1 Tax=Acuticoccus sp. I52.16.1 TaxID=2928472 RepID=UPI001FD1F61A|nr:DUF2141 domain-containing protein [Acuticoccus sp. I52.16.1]UOM34949.1 DUF2141 domain-containing protein [Acuticoccus sp. I52.16.1]
MIRLRTRLTAIFAVTAVCASSAAMAADVTITVDGIQPGTGNILVALQTEDDFLTSGGAYSVVVPAEADTMTTVLEGVEPGFYAVAVVHDENGDGTFTLGDDAPSEAWGVSGSPISEPSFDNAKIEVSDGAENAATVTISYPM